MKARMASPATHTLFQGRRTKTSREASSAAPREQCSHLALREHLQHETHPLTPQAYRSRRLTQALSFGVSKRCRMLGTHKSYKQTVAHWFVHMSSRPIKPVARQFAMSSTDHLCHVRRRDFKANGFAGLPMKTVRALSCHIACSNCGACWPEFSSWHPSCGLSIWAASDPLCPFRPCQEFLVPPQMSCVHLCLKENHIISRCHRLSRFFAQSKVSLLLPSGRKRGLVPQDKVFKIFRAKKHAPTSTQESNYCLSAEFSSLRGPSIAHTCKTWLSPASHAIAGLGSLGPSIYVSSLLSAS